jgi:hypothetical protein
MWYNLLYSNDKMGAVVIMERKVIDLDTLSVLVGMDLRKVIQSDRDRVPSEEKLEVSSTPSPSVLDHRP